MTTDAITHDWVPRKLTPERQALLTVIMEGVPTESACPNGWSPACVRDYCLQHGYGRQLLPANRTKARLLVAQLLDYAYRCNMLDRAYGIGDNGREALTYSAFDQ